MKDIDNETILEQPLVKRKRDFIDNVTNNNDKNVNLNINSKIKYFNKKSNIFKIPDKIRRQVGSCLSTFEMLKDGDKVMIGISGGKDSLSLLHILR